MAGVQIWHHHHVTAGVGVFVEDDEAVFTTEDDEIFETVRFG